VLECRHGADAHSLISFRQVPTGVSVYPFAHVHVYEFTPWEHVPPLRHGDDAHSSISTAQVLPL
jgi:hypothetical protein